MHYQPPPRRPVTLAGWIWLVYASILASFFIWALGVVGKLDEREASRQAEEYCYMVGHKLWGDYDEKYDELCKDAKPRVTAR